MARRDEANNFSVMPTVQQSPVWTENSLYIGGLNLLNVDSDNVTLGSFLDWASGVGNGHPYPGRAYFSSFIPVTAGRTYTISARWELVSAVGVFAYPSTTKYASFAFGGSDGDEWFPVSGMGRSINSTKTFTIPDGMNFLRVSCTNFGNKEIVTYQDVMDAHFKVEQGDVATVWSPQIDNVLLQLEVINQQLSTLTTPQV